MKKKCKIKRQVCSGMFLLFLVFFFYSRKMMKDQERKRVKEREALGGTRVGVDFNYELKRKGRKGGNEERVPK